MQITVEQLIKQLQDLNNPKAQIKFSLEIESGRSSSFSVDGDSIGEGDDDIEEGNELSINHIGLDIAPIENEDGTLSGEILFQLSGEETSYD